MDEQPNKITLLRDQQTYTIITATGYPGKLNVADHLTYDEMLGYVARLCCPHFSNGDPIRTWGRPLFLEAPAKREPEHPDAAGDKAPPCYSEKAWPHLRKIRIDAQGNVACAAKPGCDLLDASADAIRMGFDRNSTVRMEFNGRVYKFSPGALVDGCITNEDVPF